jgi:hypothetical protein
MNVSTRFALVLLGTVLFCAANAQDTHDDEADVLLTIEREWEAGLKGDQDKVDEMLTSNFMGWGKIEVESLCTADGTRRSLRDLPPVNNDQR